MLDLIGIVVGLIGVLVALAAFLREFVFVGRKRLGYRIQMDTPATGAIPVTEAEVLEHAGALRLLNQDNDEDRLIAPSLVLLRIENAGTTTIEDSDYNSDGDDVGVEVVFPGRRVRGMVVTELSDAGLGLPFKQEGAVELRNSDEGGPVGVVELPKVTMNRGHYYKVLFALDRIPVKPGSTESGLVPFGEARVNANIKNGTLRQTVNRTRPSRKTYALVAFLALVVAGQLAISAFDSTAPLDCAEGRLTVTGSTAFAPVLREAAESYRKRCPRASFAIEPNSSGEGIDRLQREGEANPELLAFSDGPKREGHPRLLPRPIAFTLFTLVANDDARVEDLTLDQVRRLYRGEIRNWAEIGGADVPVSVVSRNPDSGTRQAFQRQVLGGAWEPAANSYDCRKVEPGGQPGPPRCEKGSSADVLATVAGTPGAIGYNEVAAAAGRDGVVLVRIDGQPATLEGADQGAYPFWETEYAYTHGEPEADSTAASFLRYLTNEVGRDIIRNAGDKPCADLENPMLCRPER